jgi:hypothetical protein
MFDPKVLSENDFTGNALSNYFCYCMPAVVYTTLRIKVTHNSSWSYILHKELNMRQEYKMNISWV